MSDTLSIEFQITRDDWLAANRASMAESPEWVEHGKIYGKGIGWQAWLGVPGFALLAVILLPQSSAHEISTVGAAISGAIFGVFVSWGITRTNTTDRVKKAYLKQIEKMDLSAHVGSHAVRATADAVHIVAPSREVKLLWTAARPSRVTDYLLISHGGHDGTIIPTKAFPSDTDANAFFDQIVRWYHDAQGPESERLARYLADRDLPCPKCRYNLRGTRSQSCPECGTALSLDALLGKQ